MSTYANKMSFQGRKRYKKRIHRYGAKRGGYRL